MQLSFKIKNTQKVKKNDFNWTKQDQNVRIFKEIPFFKAMYNIKTIRFC